MNKCRKHGDENMVLIAHKIYYRCRVCATEARALARAKKKAAPPSELPRAPTQDQIAGRAYTTTLSCTHTSVFKISAPEKGSLVYCRRCNDYRAVTEVKVKRKEA